MLAIMLGLAVGIDYALFIVARHQDQVRAGVEPEESAARATGTAGSAVVFAGVTVLIALIGLGFANIPFLTTMGIAAAVAVAIAVIVAITLTPALLGFAKGRVAGWGHGKKRRGMPLPRRSSEAPGVSSRCVRSARSTTEDDAKAPEPLSGPELEHTQGRARAATEAAETREQHTSATALATEAIDATHAPVKKTNRWVQLVTDHPIVTTIAVVLTLGVMAIPAASLGLALPNAGQQPESSQARQAYDLTAEHFGPGFQRPAHHDGHHRHLDRSARAHGRPRRRGREGPRRQGGRARDPERDGRHRPHPDRARDRSRRPGDRRARAGAPRSGPRSSRTSTAST